MIGTVEHELVELSHELVRAVQEHDRDTARRSARREFTLQGAAGELDREALLEAASGPYEIEDFAYDEIDPEVYGNTAVIVSRYRQRARLKEARPDARDARDGRLGTPPRPLADRPTARDSRWLTLERHAEGLKGTTQGHNGEATKEASMSTTTHEGSELATCCYSGSLRRWGQGEAATIFGERSSVRASP